MNATIRHKLEVIDQQVDAIQSARALVGQAASSAMTTKAMLAMMDDLTDGKTSAHAASIEKAQELFNACQNEDQVLSRRASDLLRFARDIRDGVA